MDYYDEWIFKMANQELKNLNQLENSDVLLQRRRKSVSKYVGNFSVNSLTAFNSSVETTIDDEEDNRMDGTLNLKRKVIVKQYAPNTFR